MAFTTLSTTLIQVGKAVVQSIFQTIKDNEDDLNSRLSTVEGAVNKIIVSSGTILNGTPAASITGGFGLYRAASAFTLTDAKLAIFDVSGPTWAGTLELDVQKASSPDFTSSVSVFSTKPSISFTSPSNYTESSNMVLDVSNKDISEGDYLRIDMSSLPSGGVLGKWEIYIIGEAS
jgi:hypothetical protein